MQKVCNVLGVLGFVMSGALVGASIVAFSRVPGMIDDMAADMMDDIAGDVIHYLGGILVDHSRDANKGSY